MKRVAGLLVVLLLAVVSPVLAADLGKLCWKLEPFFDELIVNVEQPTPGVRWFVLGASWVGLDVYTLDGSGQAVALNEDTMHTISLVLYNPSPFFGDNFLDTVSIALLDGLTGVWSITTPPTAPGHQPFYQAGDLSPVVCNGTPFPGESARAQAMSSGKQLLAGFGSAEPRR